MPKMGLFYGIRVGVRYSLDEAEKNGSRVLSMITYHFG